MEAAIRDLNIGGKLITHFNDSNRENVKALEANIKGLLEGLEDNDILPHHPKVTCRKNDENVAKHFENRNIPSFTFIDPFGYKGLTIELIEKAITGWGCDCVFFFNYNRINMDITNPKVEKHMQALFGIEGLKTLAKELEAYTPRLREAKILEELVNKIKQIEIKQTDEIFVLPMTFMNSEKERTSHKLILVSKHFRGYDKMKEIMADESSSKEEGVPSLTYSEADESMPLLFALNQPLSKLKDMLVEEYAGRTFTNVDELHREHSVDKPYVRPNYTKAIAQLEKRGRVTMPRGQGKEVKFLKESTYHGDLFD